MTGGIRNGLLLSLGLAALLAAAPAARSSGYSDFNAGIALRGRNDDLAIQRLTSALADPGLLASFRPVALLARGQAHARGSHDELAIADYTASIALHPAYDAYLARAYAYYRRANIDAAVRDLNSAETLRPDLPGPKTMRLGIYIEFDRFAQALTEIEPIIAHAPKKPDYYALRAALNRRMGNYTVALSQAEDIIRDFPKAPDGYYTKVEVFESQGRIDEALSLVDDELQRFPGEFYALVKKGILLWEQGKFDKAAASFSSAVEEGPESIYAELWLALARRAAHDEMAIDVPRKTDLTQWPGPLVEFYRGNTKLDALLAAARADPDHGRRQACEAEFYAALWYLHGPDAAPAAPLRTAVLRDCPVGEQLHTVARLAGWK